MRAYELTENASPVHDLLLKLRKGMASSLNATKLQAVFDTLNAEQPGWKIEKSKSYKLSDGGWVLPEIENGTAKKFYSYGMSRNYHRITCDTLLPRPLDQYADYNGEAGQRSLRDDDERKYNTLKAMGEKLQSIQNGPEKGKWFVRDVQMGTVEEGRYGKSLVVSFELHVLTSGFMITSPDGQTYEVFGDHKNGAIGATTFEKWFKWAVENTEVMDQILAVLGMEPHEKKHDPKARYVPPPGSSAETIRVFETLRDLTQQIREEQKANLITRDKRSVMDFADAVEAGDKARIKALGESYAGFVISRCYDTREKKLRDGWEATIEKLAEDVVEEMQNQFVYKNTGKLASIASRKGNLKDIKIAALSAQSGIITASLLLSFDDGSSFRVDQSVVLSRSVHNLPFYRFPTTFHNVVLPDGSKMGIPSEERMNTVFAA